MPCLFCPEAGPCIVCGGREPVVDRPPLDATPRGRVPADFGTIRYPLRCSGLSNLVTCPWRVLMEFLFNLRDESGTAADTGSATHAAVAAWHLMGQDAAAAIETMVMKQGEFPRADLDEAAALFLLYSRDPRNQKAEIVAVERQVDFVLPACEEDPTKEAIVVQGRIDQIRRVDGRLEVYDLKTSKLPGKQLMDEHVYQVAAYVCGAAVAFGEPVHPGSLICPRHYGKQQPETAPDGVFFRFPWTFDDAKFVLWGIRRIVASIRAGEVWHKGGMHCRWCPAGSPDVCVPRLRAATDASTMKIDLSRCRVVSQDLDFGAPIDF